MAAGDAPVHSSRSGSPPRLAALSLAAAVVLLVVGLGRTLPGAIDEARLAETRQRMQAIAAALEVYDLRHGTYPASDGWAAILRRDGALVHERDGWGHELEYTFDGGRNSWTLVSRGRDGLPQEHFLAGDARHFDCDIVHGDRRVLADVTPGSR